VTEGLRFVAGDLAHPAVRDLLQFHLDAANANSPPGFVHALNLRGLTDPAVTFWSVWSGDALVGMGALKRFDAGHGEIKSMRVAPGHERRGIGQAILDHLLDAARAAGLTRVSLETGGNDAFAAARALYERNGFAPCGGFGDYVPGEFTRLYTRVV